MDELLLGIEIALDRAPAEACSAISAGGIGSATVVDLVAAVDHAVAGCTTAVTTPTPTPTATSTMPACVSDGSATVVASSAMPATGSGALQASCVTVENAGGTRSELTRVSARGTVNGLDLLLQVYFLTATGEIDTVSYGWAPFPGTPDFYENLAFCNAPACTGVTMSLATKQIRFTNTALSASTEASAVLNGTITLNRIPTPVATPTPPCPGGSASLNFTDVQGTNTSQPLPATLVLGTAMNFTRSADPPVFAYLSALYDACPMPFPRLTLGFQFSGAPIQAGTSYQVGSMNGQLNQIEFREEGFSSAKSWEAQSGTLVVDSSDGAQVTFRIIDARMRPRDTGTRGTFTLNASATLNAP